MIFETRDLLETMSVRVHELRGTWRDITKHVQGKPVNHHHV